MTTTTIFRKSCTILALATLIGATAWAQTPAPVPAEVKPVSVPFELVASNHMVVRAKINGKGPFRLVFDSGAPVSLLGNKAAEESGVVAKDAPKSFMMGMRGEGLAIKSLEVGDLSGKDVGVIVLDHPTLKALGGFLGKPLDGIIGFSFFTRYKTTIDYQAKVMTFVPVEFQGRDLMKDLQARMTGPKVTKTRVLTPSGLWGLTLSDPLADGSGVAIQVVRAGSPAESAGLKTGDVLTTLDGRWTATVADVYAASTGVAPGQAAEAVILRDGQVLRLTVKPVGGI